jgi:putative oxidoreductase
MKKLEMLRPLALLLLRWGIGIVFIYHGYPKVAHSQQWTQSFAHMGFPSYFAYIAGVLELLGGALLIAGLFTRVSGLLLAGEMAIALWRVHLPQGSLLNVGNYQLPLLLAVAAFTLAAVGAGAISLDYAIFRNKA